MAINNTNTVSTLAGVDSVSSYIRLECKLLPSGKAAIKYFLYKDKASYSAGNPPINDAYDFNYNSYITDVLIPSDINIDNLHDLAIAELVSRGLDGAKLSKVDLV
jgi:hypothetical protein